jgi:hypothetical protein
MTFLAFHFVAVKWVAGWSWPIGPEWKWWISVLAKVYKSEGDSHLPLPSAVNPEPVCQDSGARLGPWMTRCSWALCCPILSTAMTKWEAFVILNPWDLGILLGILTNKAPFFNWILYSFYDLNLCSLFIKLRCFVDTLSLAQFLLNSPEGSSWTLKRWVLPVAYVILISFVHLPGLGFEHRRQRRKWWLKRVMRRRGETGTLWE